MKTQIPIIHQETFEAWLFSQPNDRAFRYTDCTNCLLCMFLRENTSLKEPIVSDTDYHTQDDFRTVEPIPQFAYLALREGMRGMGLNGIVPFSAIKSAYRKLYPEAVPDDVLQGSATPNSAIETK